MLAFDTTGRGCSAALLDGSGAVLAHRTAAELERGHAERLMPMLREVLEETKVAVGALGLIAVTTGPGAFTGIRIGLAAAHGLALASGVALRGVTSFAAVAAAIDPEERADRPLLVAIDSRRVDIFVQHFAADGTASAPAVLPPAALADWVPPGELALAGDAAEAAAAALRAAGRAVVLSPRLGPPDAAHVGRAALAAWRAGEPGVPPQPFYLRAPAVTLPRQPAAASP